MDMRVDMCVDMCLPVERLKEERPREKIRRKKMMTSEYSILTSGSKLRKFGCAYCHRDISFSLKIHCAECTNFTLCSDCFSAGVNLGAHVSSHDYKIADCLDCALFTKEWTISDELLLLEGK